MLKKNYSKTGRVCRVTFKMTSALDAGRVNLCGDFNDWNQETDSMKQLKDGGFSTTITLEAGRTYRFRYLLDGEKWENDWEADDYWPNDFGGDDSVVQV